MSRWGDPEARFWAKVHQDGDCLVRPAGNNGGGYGKLYWRGRKRYAHHVALELMGTPLPEGMETDHYCKNTACILHLEIVTRLENVRRSRASAAQKARHAKVTHCPQGHLYDDENTLWVMQSANKHGRRYRSRQCRTCNVARTREWRAKQEAAP